MRDEAKLRGEGRSPFGDLLREFRISAGLSQESLAERARVSAVSISTLERGTRRAPHRETIELLAAALELPERDRARLQAAAVRPPIPRRRGPRAMGDERVAQHNLPLPLTSFHGREEERGALQTRLAEQRLITLTGVGGVGKTRLALETARSVVERFPDGVRYVELAPLADPGLVTQRIATALGLAVGYEGAEPNSGWVAQLARKRLLVVLDNCEHVLGAAAAVAQHILERCPATHVLATSREALRVDGEFVVRLDPLALPAADAGRPFDLAELRASPALSLFMDRARHVAPTLRLGEDAAAWQTVGNICARLDGLPLAIELAAARMNAVTLATLAGSLDGRFQVLTNGVRTALPRHRTLHALIDWSYDLLGEPERRVFRRVAVFSGGWTLQSAQAVCADEGARPNELLATLCSLVDKSLVVADQAPDTLRYAMLETTRAYALERLQAAGERDSTSRRHAEYYGDLLRRCNATLYRVPLTESIFPLERELDNLRAALEWCLIERRDVALGAMIAAAETPALGSSSLADEGRRWCERALAALESDPSPWLEAPLQYGLAQQYVRLGYHELAVGPGMRSVELCRTMPEMRSGQVSARARLALSLTVLAWALVMSRRFQEGYPLAEEAVAIARGESPAFILAWALVVKAHFLDDAEARRALLGEALELARSLPRGYIFESLALIGFSYAEFDAGIVDAARRYAVEAAECLRESGFDEDMEHWALSIAATCAVLSGDLDGALAYARDALSLLGGRFWVFVDMNLVQVIASVLAIRGQSRDAARLIGVCEAAYARVTAPRHNYAQTLYDRTLALLGHSASSAQVEAWLAEGRTWSYERSVAVALDYARGARLPVSESHSL